METQKNSTIKTTFNPRNHQISEFYNHEVNKNDIVNLCNKDVKNLSKDFIYTTTYITLVGGAGTGKTTIASLLFAELKLLGKNVDLIPEVVRDKIFEEKISDLNDQYHISKKQYDKYWSRNGKVEFVVSDTSLINGIYYNKYNCNNVSNENKTFKSIIKWFHMFNNIVIYVKRGSHYEYDSTGRVHSFEESLHADEELLKCLDKNRIDYITFESSKDIKKKIEILAKSIIETIIRAKSKIEFEEDE